MVNDLVDLTLKIAREKVACDYNIHGAESFLGDALGLPKEPKLIADILLGNKSLVMNSDSGGNVEDVVDENNKINIPECLQKEVICIQKQWMDFNVYNLKSRIQHITLEFADAVAYYINNENPFEYNDDASYYFRLYDELLNDISILNKINECWNYLFGEDLKDVYCVKEMLECYKEQMLNDNFESPEEKALSKYTDAYKRIAELGELLPTKEYHDAGWIAPNGDYYGLDGTAANFLHINISNRLMDQQIVPESNNPDEWMEKNKWIKQHGDKIFTTDSAHNEKTITPLQLETIIKIIGNRYTTVEFPYQNKYISIDELKHMNIWDLHYKLIG